MMKSFSLYILNAINPKRKFYTMGGLLFFLGVIINPQCRKIKENFEFP